MPEIRKDPVINRWVIIASERGRRPSEYKTEPEPASDGPCVFCKGREDETPPETFRIEDKNPEHGWRIRAFVNKFPALSPGASRSLVDDGLYSAVNGNGAHEVIVETSDHRKQFEEFGIRETRDVLCAWRERYRGLCGIPEHRHVLVFKNAGKEAGASLEHAHSQVIASPLVPSLVLEQIAGAAEYWRKTGKCVYCTMIEREIEKPERKIIESELFIVYAPYASCFPFQLHILPKRHSANFGDIRDEEIADMAKVLNRTMKSLAKLLNSPAYNLVLHSAPCEHDSSQSYHWHLEVVPRLTKIAGFEWGSGCYINPTSPESAAAALREQAEDTQEDKGGSR